MTSESWEPHNLLTAVTQGQVFLGWLDASFLVRLHGTGADGLQGFLRDHSDLGVSRVPRGASLEIDHGQPARAGDPDVALGDAVNFAALPLLVLALTGSGVLMGIVGVLSQLPDLIFGLPVGFIVMMVVSRMTTAPSKEMQDFVDSCRRPRGGTIMEEKTA